MITEDDAQIPTETVARTEAVALPEGGVKITFFRPDGSEIGWKEMTSTQATMLVASLEEAIDKWKSLS